MDQKGKTAQPGDILYPGAPAKVCALRDVPINTLRLPAKFLDDLTVMFRHHNQKAILYDVLNSAVTKSTLQHLPENLLTCLSGANSFAVIAAILLRPSIDLRPAYQKADRKPRLITRDEREALLMLLYHYGVQCATGTCCGLVTDPIRAEDAA